MIDAIIRQTGIINLDSGAYCMTKDVIAAIRRELEEQVDEKTKADYQRVFKEKVTYYGVKNYIVNKIAGKYFREVQPLGKKKIFQLGEELLKTDYCEEAFIAFEWSYRLHNQYEPEDFFLF
jgi:3-methyladenine DNA glycosylase AlkD